MLVPTLRNVESFGDVAAEDDAVLEYFVETNSVKKIEDGQFVLVLGRKGSGKTAIVRYFTERSITSIARAINLKGYPWNVHARWIDAGASEMEAYVCSWRFFMAVQIASTVLERRKFANDDTRRLEEFLKENYNVANPSLADVMRPKTIKFSKISIAPAVLGNSLGGIDIERKSGDFNFAVELNALTDAILSHSFDIIVNQGLGSFYFHFDELDQGMSTLDDQRRKIITGLILASRELRKEGGKAGAKIFPVVYLRTDLWNELHFSDKNKISQTNALVLNWNLDSLLALVEMRLRVRLGSIANWSNISTPDLMRGSQTKWNHMLARTFLRPRDVIRFLNAALAEAKLRPENPLQFTNKDIVNCRDAYSNYLKSELDDEIASHWPKWDEALRVLSLINTITFDRDSFTARYESARSSDNSFDAATALAMLYKFSVIGYRKSLGYGGTAWSFHYSDSETGWDNASTLFKVHLGLKEYAKLREARQT